MAFVLIMSSILKIKVLYMFRSPVHLQIPISGQLQGSSLWDVGPSTQIRTVQKFRTDFFYHQPKYEKHLKVIPEDETPEILNSNCSPTSEVKSVSPNCPRVSPPHHGFGSSASWMILRSLNPSPSLNPSSEQWISTSPATCCLMMQRHAIYSFEFQLPIKFLKVEWYKKNLLPHNAKAPV